MTECQLLITQILCEESGGAGCAKSPGGYCERCTRTAARIHFDLEARAIEKAIEAGRITPHLAEKILASQAASDEAKAIASAVLGRREAA